MDDIVWWVVSAASSLGLVIGVFISVSNLSASFGDEADECQRRVCGS